MFVGAEHRSLIAIAGFDGSGDFCFCVIKAASLLNLAIALRMRLFLVLFWSSVCAGMCLFKLMLRREVCCFTIAKAVFCLI